ncbi:hypothetical protein GWA01_09530 [Gluconobacter wancherniae NBRC 103581]|uniref:Uncharacterized protein n=1 Tax=Gluconobacter wancherniae NBRC 103581 TaxID=656744 RepID=A0A511B0R2_9PROT|nr:hypothetical protein AA103581_2066 [Gluconobacter wancherniae NBRC 103581]GEK93183.1 hypothetical protein GWA01_09530 [Gluconobacter wancherniae NBRC 103581]
MLCLSRCALQIASICLDQPQIYVGRNTLPLAVKQALRLTFSELKKARKAMSCLFDAKALAERLRDGSGHRLGAMRHTLR